MSTIQPEIQRFVDAVTEQGQIWVLSTEGEYVVCDSVEFEQTDVMPLFSSEQAAKALCQEDWSEYEAKAVSVDDFFEQWLPSLDEDKVMVGLDWDEELNGVECDPFELAKLLADSGI
ncbi:DUF2750 domain-containing protein [Ferrimonas marina]|uniref:DUF2750 domain-containing protein n=1 Tax=Ferrimonas marina TaxID=299255 RepID=A0A1M5NLG3_9GAMM|nr:DUF2750 domain-containing protein [Ferrimonas marina]SHG90307.1 Protein of unknown function [Ferrimonas marina]